MTTSLHTRDQDGRPGLRNWQKVMEPASSCGDAAQRVERHPRLHGKDDPGALGHLDRAVRRECRGRGHGDLLDQGAEAGIQLHRVLVSSQPRGADGADHRPVMGHEGHAERGAGDRGGYRKRPRTAPAALSRPATPNALVWCRSNRSMRVFNTTLEALAEGRQPAVGDLNNVCYLMRNTGLDGNGTFGTRRSRRWGRAMRLAACWRHSFWSPT